MNLTTPTVYKRFFISIKRWPDWIGYLAVAWSIIYVALHLFWLFGGSGYPFKNEMGLFSSIFSYIPAQVGGIIFVILCLAGIGIGFAMQRPSGSAIPRWLVIFYGWGFALGLLLFIPDISLIMIMAYAFLLKFAFSWGFVNQIFCMIGALIWGLTVLAYQRRTHNACEFCGRSENVKAFILVRWGRWLTMIAVLAPVPYALSRFAWALEIPFGVDSQFLQDFARMNPTHHITEWVFGSVCIGGSILTLGLIQKWGEIFPHWFPFIGGKRVPISLALIPASIVAIAITAAGIIFTFAFIAVTFHLVSADNMLLDQIWGTVGPMVFWIPWGATLGLAAIAYYYRRRGGCDKCGEGFA